MVDQTTQNTLEILRSVNVQRCGEAFHPVESWSPTDWSNAIGSEAGEVAGALLEALGLCEKVGMVGNTTKKLLRGDYGPGVSREAQQNIAHELADVIIYSDLLAARMGINLCVAIREKFNIVSERRNSTIKMPL